jgi:hypothetical protein
MSQDTRRQVSRDEFYEAMGPLNVHPCPVGPWPYTSLWKLNGGAGPTVGWSEGYLPMDSALPQTRYYLP